MRKLNIKEIINNDYILVFKKYITSYWICVKAASIPSHGVSRGTLCGGH